MLAVRKRRDGFTTTGGAVLSVAYQATVCRFS